jgi:curli biogenesis system outer membrane secretion channel CsgG
MLYEKDDELTRPVSFAGDIFCLSLAVLLLVACAKPIAPPVSSEPVAVWDFEDFSPVSAAPPGMGEMLATRSAAAIQAAQRFTLVERQRLLDLLNEQNLGSSGLADESTRLRLGRLLGARWMVFGSFQVIGNQMRLDIRLVQVETGRVVQTAQRMLPAGDIAQWLEATETATRQLLTF